MKKDIEKILGKVVEISRRENNFEYIFPHGVPTLY